LVALRGLVDPVNMVRRKAKVLDVELELAILGQLAFPTDLHPDTFG